MKKNILNMKLVVVILTLALLSLMSGCTKFERDNALDPGSKAYTEIETIYTKQGHSPELTLKWNEYADTEFKEEYNVIIEKGSSKIEKTVKDPSVLLTPTDTASIGGGQFTLTIEGVDKDGKVGDKRDAVNFSYYNVYYRDFEDGQGKEDWGFIMSGATNRILNGKLILDNRYSSYKFILDLPNTYTRNLNVVANMIYHHSNSFQGLEMGFITPDNFDFVISRLAYSMNTDSWTNHSFFNATYNYTKIYDSGRFLNNFHSYGIHFDIQNKSVKYSFDGNLINSAFNPWSSGYSSVKKLYFYQQSASSRPVEINFLALWTD